MTKLTSKIPGVNLWAYDFSRRPDKTLDANGSPLVTALNTTDPRKDVIYPVTQNPTEFLDKPLNLFRTICDPQHSFNGTSIPSHGILATGATALDEQLTSFDGYSTTEYARFKFAGDEAYISQTSPVTRDASFLSFTTKTPGINIVYQTGIIPPSNGRSVIVFEVETGYKISSGSMIAINPTIKSPASSRPVHGTPKTLTLAYDVTPGIYYLTSYPDDTNTWLSANVDFATVQDETTPTPTPTDPTPTPTDPTPTPTAPTTISIVQKLTNVNSNINGDSIDRKINAISLTADPGYTFQSNIFILFYSGENVVYQNIIHGNNETTITIPLNTTTRNTITDNMDKIVLTATATLVNLPNGYEHNYLITDTELGTFSADKIWTASEDGQGVDVYDVTKFINNLIELPFVVQVTTAVNNISVGKKQSSVVSHEAQDRFVILDLGKITVPAKYKNAYDYQNKSIKLYTPFVSPITIQNENAIDKTIHISYKIDISNGNLTVNLYNDDVLFFTGTNNVASQLPFLNSTKNVVINRDNHFTDNDIRQPYIVISREAPILNNDYYPTNERGLIKEYNGNIRVRLLNNMNIPYNELSELTQQLESGVNYAKNN